MPSPVEVRAEFDRRFAADSEAATDYLYKLGIDSGYIKQEAIARNICWEEPSPWGTLEITINCSKPEKDPRAIAAAAATAPTSSRPEPEGRSGEIPRRSAEGSLPPSAFGAHGISPLASLGRDDVEETSEPQCDLCWENETWPGSPEHPAKPGLRIAAIPLGSETWGLQFSPYAYFPEHCIALAPEHRPMRIDDAAIGRLLDFVDLFPFYFIGSNADLPIVGGSILSHDHFQGGRHVFPLMKAPLRESVQLRGFPNVTAGIVDWPASTLRLASSNRSELQQAATHILQTWQTFSFPEAHVLATSPAPTSAPDSPPLRHNTLNPVVTKTGDTYTLHLVLRNNRTDAAHPWGIFHPTPDLHHIKKENIGLIEIMGRAILPGRLAKEMPAIKPEINRAFPRILECTGVFRDDETGRAGWQAFIEKVNA